MPMPDSKKLLRACAAAALIAALEALFFRNVLGNGRLFGENWIADGRLTMLLSEHWHRFFRGKEAFADLAMFYPVKGTVGYSEMFLGFGLVHSLLRFLGLDVYLAYKLTLMAVHVFGSFSMYYLLRKKLSLGAIWSLFGLVAFSLSPAFAREASEHSQLFAMSLLPFLAVLFVDIVQGFASRRRRNLYSCAFIAFFVLIMDTAWYVAFFAALFLLVLLVVYLLSLGVEAGWRAAWRDVRAFFAAFGRDLLWLLPFALVMLAPFVLVYLPVLKSSGGYGWNEAFAYSPEFADILNVGGSNLLLGGLIKKLHMDGRLELEEGMSIVLLAVYALALRFFLKGMWKEGTRRQVFFSSLALSCLAGLFLPLRLSGMGLSLWRFLVWKLVPGAKSIRAVARFLFFLSFPISVAASAYGSRKLGLSRRPGLAAAVSAALIPLLLLTQVRRGGVLSEWEASARRAFVASFPPPPDGCEAFYVTDSVNPGRAQSAQMDAFELASFWDLPTMNGYLSGIPGAWGKLWLLSSEDYLPGAAYIIRRYGLENVWQLDLGTRSWSRPPEVQELMGRERSWKFDGTHIVWGGHEEGGKRFLRPGGLSEGPGWTVFPGSYRAVIRGENLEGMELDVNSGQGKVHYPASCEFLDGEVRISFSVQDLVPDLELLVRNASDRLMVFSSFTLAMAGGE